MVDTSIRIEKDLLGVREVPAQAYWGVHTLRARENFQVTGATIGEHASLVRALASVKHAAALANERVGVLDADRAALIAQACVEIREGRFHDQFVVDPIQGGAGTSTNMNANEVIANVALELAGAPRGDYARLHPNEHVNLSQSTNDAYPTAARIALIEDGEALREALRHLEGAFRERAGAFKGIVKLGRTQLQDAVPMTLGEEFGAFATMMDEDVARLGEALSHLLEVNLGGTAIGTGVAAPAEYRVVVIEELRRLTGLQLRSAPDLIEASQDCGALLLLSGMLRRIAVKLSKICNDLRLLSSGPHGGFGEINLPPRQAGSSLMPGKINPVIPEMVNQVAFDVIGKDVTVGYAAEAGQLQLNAFEPIIVHAILTSLRRLSRAARALADDCVAGISANDTRMRDHVDTPPALLTALVATLGYQATTELARRARDGQGDVRGLVRGLGLDDAQIDLLLLSR